MGRALAPSKSKKNSEEDRRKRKNPKTRRRRRVSFPPSSSSSDDDGDDVSRRRRSSRRKPVKSRGRDPKRSLKKRSRKARQRSVSSSGGDDSSSCSTCRSRSSGSPNRSRSPARGRYDRKGKLKKKVKRGRKLDRVVRSLRNRNRSLSCSTCSGSSEPSQIHSYREVKDGYRQIGSSSLIESRGEVEERYGSRDREMDNDDSPLARAEEDSVMDEGSYEQQTEIERWMSEANVDNDSYFDQIEDSVALASGPYKELELNDTKLSRRIKSEIVAADKHDSDSDNLELILRQRALENLKKVRGRLSSDNRTSDDRKKELAGAESFEKQCETARKNISSPKSDTIVSKDKHIQLGIPANDSKLKPFIQVPSLEANYSTSDKKMLSSHLNQNRNAKQLGISINRQSTSNRLPKDMEDFPEKISSCLVSQEKKATEVCESGNKSFRFEINLGDGKEKINENSKTVEECQSGSQKISLCRGSQEKKATEGCESDNRSFRFEVNLGDGKETINENSKTVEECQSGSQFEQKTFSRMHDGEMVQVSYKVYIPKKTPALARRKLQR
ncbi:pre-mRNA-splicing factor CWC25 [Phalaenopsis equestris]|uniref:pre-mRNA-splicing factor CWC25 n=1 Tax=Phalaenopsis equestris TaxID=78828 RepID=UPI0009E35130|nr:pre-mRNA-splicing factor CWC25 [Phalaenopsis equestris]